MAKSSHLSSAQKLVVYKERQHLAGNERAERSKMFRYSALYAACTAFASKMLAFLQSKIFLFEGLFEFGDKICREFRPSIEIGRARIELANPMYSRRHSPRFRWF